MFIKNKLENNEFCYNTLEQSFKFSTIGKGRRAANLVELNGNFEIPIVRTTTVYEQPAEKFNNILYKILDKIKEIHQNLKFNNALIEIYEEAYNSMRFHSDQALDLEPNSYICIFSCYKSLNNLRKLVVKNKFQNKIVDEILLDDSSIVLFSLDTNSTHLHQIKNVENEMNNTIEEKNNWLGITFRLSKTFVKFDETNMKIPMLIRSNKPLRLANEEEKKEFYRMRKNENNQIKFEYPELDYTISISDCLPISS
jgi:hypothetical protein